MTLRNHSAMESAREASQCKMLSCMDAPRKENTAAMTGTNNGRQGSLGSAPMLKSSEEDVYWDGTFTNNEQI